MKYLIEITDHMRDFPDIPNETIFYSLSFRYLKIITKSYFEFYSIYLLI
jgi:hypothetical protein